MKRIVVALACVAAVAAYGKDTRTLSEFMSKCNAASRECHNTLRDYVNAARDQNMICLPAGLSTEEATDDMRDWMRNATKDAALAAGNVEDGQWAAVTALWPCPPPGDAAPAAGAPQQ